MTLTDVVLNFHSSTMAKPLSAAANSLFFAMLRAWNAARRPDSITMSSVELRRLAGIRSYQTFHDALETIFRLKLARKLWSKRSTSLSVTYTFLPKVDSMSKIAETVKSQALLIIPKTETEGVREGEPKTPDKPSRYEGLSFAQIIEMRRRCKTNGGIRDANTGIDRSGEKAVECADVEGRASDS